MSMEIIEKQKVRIWLVDNVEPEGGFWINAKICDVIVKHENIIVEEGFAVDLGNTLDSFTEIEGAKIDYECNGKI